MSKNNEQKVVVEPETEVVNDTPETEEKVVVYIGKIRDCDRLNVRKEPSIDSKVICKLDKKSEVQIDKSKSTKEFYKIITPTGDTGYCMKKYMTIKKQEA